jgi:hypothetical protein
MKIHSDALPVGIDGFDQKSETKRGQSIGIKVNGHRLRLYANALPLPGNKLRP